MKETNTTTDTKKQVKTSEFVLYLMGVFFYTTMTGMLNANRNAYLVNVLQLKSEQTAFFNAVVAIVPFILNFFIVMYIDGRKMGKTGKFRPLATLTIIPMGILLFLSFWAPPALTGDLLLVYVITVAILWAVCGSFGNSINMIANVMTTNLKERDKVLSFRSISSAVGNSAPLVILLVIGLIWKNNEGLQYLIGAGLCGAVGIITVLLGMKVVRERVTYTAEKQNPLLGFKEILFNKYARTIILSETLKSFRGIST